MIKNSENIKDNSREAFYNHKFKTFCSGRIQMPFSYIPILLKSPSSIIDNSLFKVIYFSFYIFAYLRR